MLFLDDAVENASEVGDDRRHLSFKSFRKSYPTEAGSVGNLIIKLLSLYYP